MLSKYRIAAWVIGSIALVVALVGGGFSVGWQWQAAEGAAALDRAQRLHADTLGEISRAAAGQLQRQQQRTTQLQHQLAQLDRKHHSEMTSVQSENTQLVVDLAAAYKRLSVRTTPGPAASGGGVRPGAAPADVDNAAGARADIHPATAANLVRVTARADECRAKLTGLQAWARLVTAPHDG